MSNFLKWQNAALKGRNYERKLAKEGVGKLIPLSGAGTEKQDLKSELFLIQAKHTDAQVVFSLEKAELLKVVRDAALKGKIGILILDFSGDEYVIVRRRDFEDKLGVVGE